LASRDFFVAHWKYKGGIEHVSLEWLKSLNYRNESVEEFYELAKGDLFSEEVSVFSPEGDYYTLPKDAVALDFAYAVHSDIGRTSTGAIVNEEKASLLTILKNGDRVHIITDGKPRLHCSWESTVKTSKAKSGIRASCRKRLKEVDEYVSYNILGTLFGRDPAYIKKISAEIGIGSTVFRAVQKLDTLKEKISRISKSAGIKEVRFWELLKKGYKRPQRRIVKHFVFFSNKTIDRVEFDHCCHPKVGDNIVAFYDGGKAMIHHKLCMNAYSSIVLGKSMLFVQWNHKKMGRYRLILSLQNQKGELAKLLVKLSSLNLNIVGIEFGISNSDIAEYCTLEVESNATKKIDIEKEISKRFKLIEIIALDDAYNSK